MRCHLVTECLGLGELLHGVQVYPREEPEHDIRTVKLQALGSTGAVN